MVICALGCRRGAIRLMDVTVTGPEDTCTLWPHILVSPSAMVSEQWPPRWRTEDWHRGVSRTPKRRRRRCAYAYCTAVVVGRAGSLRVLRDRVKPLAFDIVPVTTDVGTKVIGGGARHVAIVSRGTPIQVRLSDRCCRRRRVLCVLKSKYSNFIILRYS